MNQIEAIVVHDIPDDLAALIGKVIAAYSRLENNTIYLTALLLQLNKVEARIALRNPRPAEALDMALDLFTLKAIRVTTDTASLRPKLEKAKADRDAIGHGMWLRHPTTNELYLRLSRGSWDKSMTGGDKISRAIFPQAIPYGPTECQLVLNNIEDALRGVDALGAELDAALQSFPERFRPLAPVLNPTGRREPKTPSKPPRPQS